MKESEKTQETEFKTDLRNKVAIAGATAVVALLAEKVSDLLWNWAITSIRNRKTDKKEDDK